MNWGCLRIFVFVPTVHKDITEKLPGINAVVYSDVKKILEINKQERHIRGGMATKHKYEERNRCKGTPKSDK